MVSDGTGESNHKTRKSALAGRHWPRLGRHQQTKFSPMLWASKSMLEGATVCAEGFEQ